MPGSTRPSLRRLAGGALLLAASGCLVACEPRIAVELLDVTAVEAERIDAGHRLSVAGRRFLLGHPCTFVLRGTWHRPGAAPEHRERTIAGEATSSELAEATVTEEVVRALGGRATFVGDLEVRFDAASIPGGIVHGALHDVTLDFVPAARGATRAELDALERATGARFADASEEPGAEIADVAPGGLFANLGLEPGDRIVSRGGLRVLEVSDLLLEGVPDTERSLGILRGSTPFEVLPAPPAAPTGLSPVRAHQLAALLLVVALALGLSARARRTHAGAERLAGPAHGVATVVVALGLQRAIVAGLVLDVSLVVGAGVLLILLGGALGADRDRGAALTAGTRALALAAVVLSAAALAGTTSLAALGERAGGDVSLWPGLGTALGPAAALGLVVSCTQPARADRTLGEGVLDALGLGLVSAIAAAVLYGGTGGPEPAAAIVFVVRAVVVATAIAIARSTLGALSRAALAALAVASAALCAASTYLSLVEPLDTAASGALAETLVLALVLLLGLAVAARQRAPLSVERELEI